MAIAYVRDTGTIKTTGTTQTSSASFASTPAVNSLIVVGGGSYYAGQGNQTVASSDNQSNTYATAIQVEDGGGDVPGFITYATATNASGTFTVTVDAAGTSNTMYTWAATEFSGATPSSVLDKTASQSEGAGSTSITTTTTATLSQADEMVYTVLVLSSNTTHGSLAASGYTINFSEGDSTTYVAAAGGYKIVSATTGVNAAWTWTSISGYGEVAVLATFKAALAGATNILAWIRA